nr:ABC transporter substrate-binding protein [Pinisolibacter aquiterrae]
MSPQALGRGGAGARADPGDRRGRCRPARGPRRRRGGGVKVVHLEDDWSERGVLDKVARIGAEIGRTAQAERLAARIRAEFATLAETRAAFGTCPRVLFLLAFSNDRPLVGGGAMIALAGGVNVATGFSGYKQMTDEAILSSAPDVVVTMANPADAISVDELFTMSAFRDVPAAKGRRLVTMDGADLLAFGPRTARMATNLMARIAGSDPAASRCSDANRATNTPAR